MSNLRIYKGEAHPHEAQSPEKLDVATLNTAGLLATANVAYYSTGGATPTFATTKANANLSWQYNGATGAVTKGSSCNA